MTSFNINDSHNVSTIGIDGDGYLHVSWGVHNNGLLYTRSTAPVVNDDPFTVPGNLENAIPEQGESITYPEFWNVPGSGDLLLSYRTGGSGNGEYQLARWNDQSDLWSPVHVRVDSPSSQSGPQPWIDNDFSFFQPPPNVNAYHNGLAYDSDHRLHTTWTWRTGGDSQTGFTDYQSNHNLMYAYSDNHGVDWYQADGTAYQRNGQHDIDENNAPPVLDLPDGSSLINQASSAVGPDYNYYLATWYAPQAAAGNHLRQYMLVEYDGQSWDTHQISDRTPEANGIGTDRVPESQLGTVRMSRPTVLVDDDNRVLVVYSDYQRGQGVTVAYSESPSRDDWQFVDLTTDEDLRMWEPKYDLHRWESDGVLSMLYQPTGGGLSPTPMSILEWDARAFFLDAISGPAMQIEVDRRTGAVTLTNPASQTRPITGYAIDSASGQLAPGQWQSLAGQATDGWAELQAASTALAESTTGQPLALAELDSLALGNPYAREAIAFGVDQPADLEFHYTIDGQSHTGEVTYVGDSTNNLMLLVDTGSGKAFLKNSSPFAVDIDAYSILSSEGELAFENGNWRSLADQHAAGGHWFEANVDQHRVTEFNSAGATTLAAEEVLDLGTLFQPGGQQDLQFEFLMADEDEAREGLVVYDLSALAVALPGDYNNDGTVDTADYTTWRDQLGQSVVLPNDPTPGAVTAGDYTVWKSHFGNALGGTAALAGAVPEPTSAALLLSLALVQALARYCGSCGNSAGSRTGRSACFQST